MERRGREGRHGEGKGLLFRLWGIDALGWEAQVEGLGTKCPETEAKC